MQSGFYDSLYYYESIAGVIETGAYGALDDIVVKDWSETFINDIDDALWGSCTKDGKHYFVCIARSCYGFLYRKDLFEEAGIDVNSIKNIYDFAEQLKKIRRIDENGMNIYPMGLAYNTSSTEPGLLLMALASSGDLFNDDGTANFNTPVGVKALELQKALIDDYQIVPESAFSYNIDDVQTDFSAGKYACIIGSSARFTTIRDNSTFDPENLGFLAIPQIVEGKDTMCVSGGWCLGFWSKSPHAYEAAKFIERFASAEVDWMMVETGGQVPVNKSTWDNHAEFFLQEENQWMEVCQNIMENRTIPYPSTPVEGVRDYLYEAMQDYYLNGMSAEAALEKAEANFNEANFE